MLTNIKIKELKNNYMRNCNSIVNLNCKKFEEFKSKKKSSESLYTTIFIEKVKHIFSLVQNAMPKIDIYLKTETPYFNIFKIIGLDRKEVTTHTPFLANLLSPFDSHQQSFLFLQLFFEKILKFTKEEIGHIEEWYIQKEFEHIDLRIVNDNLLKAVFIENKIDTSAHSGQLSNYFSKWKSKYSGGAFIYLNINGDLPPNEGFNESIYSKKDVMNELKVLSYKKDIREWLESCVNQIQSQKVLYTVNQYLELINYL